MTLRAALYGHLVEQLAALGIAYVQVIQGETGGPRYPEDAIRCAEGALQ